MAAVSPLRTYVPFLRTTVLVFENSPTLDLTVGRSTVRQNILALLMAGSGSRLHLREIQRRAGTSPGTASRELAKLVAAGLVEREAEGNQVYFRASTSPFATMLRAILVAMPAPEYGPRPPRVARTRSIQTQAASAAEPQTVELALAEPPAAAATPAPTQPDPAATRIIGPMPAAPAPIRATAIAPDTLGLKVASRLAESIRPMYGDSLRGIYLYGARAAGPAPADADVETLIVLDRVDHYGAELEKTSHVCASLAHEFGVIVSRIFVAESAWGFGPDGKPPAIRAEAMAV
jgi:DNA-binding transcriptional ArsR family regulator